ncbi:MAG: guanylate kinase [Pseudomonadota bacterium]
MRGQLYVISAPSGAGKTSLVKALREHLPGIAVSVSHTTRAIRPGEADGVHYHFVDHAAFERMAAHGEFLEHARVFDHYYGTSKAAVDLNLAAGQDVILEIDWQGARQVRTLFPEALGIFILPPARAVLEARLRGRGQDGEDIIARRMRDAKTEMEHYAEFDYLIVNDVFDEALHELASIFRAERLNLARAQARHARLINELLA